MGWPKSSFRFSFKIVQKTWMNFFANPIFWILAPYQIHDLHIPSPFNMLPFQCKTVSFTIQKLFSLMWFHLSIFAFVSLAFGVRSMSYHYMSLRLSVKCYSLSHFWLSVTPRTVARLLCPWESTGKNTGVGCHSLLQGNCRTQESKSCLRHCRQILYHLSHQGLPMFSSNNFVVLGLTFKSLIHFELTFVYSVRQWSSFILFHVTI